MTEQELMAACRNGAVEDVLPNLYRFLRAQGFDGAAYATERAYAKYADLRDFAEHHGPGA